MTTDVNLFDAMFRHAEKFSLEEFNDEDMEKEGITFEEYSEEIIMEGLIRAGVKEAGRDFSDAYREMKGWFQGIESKRRTIDEGCLETIEWLREEDRDNPRLDLDMNKFKTWLKTSETFYWRYYFLLHDGIYNDLMKQIKKGDLTMIEDLTDFSLGDRKKVTRMIDSIRKIPDLMALVEKYRARSNAVFDGLVKRDRKIQSFPFQVMLLGYNDLNRTVKRIVELAT